MDNDTWTGMTHDEKNSELFAEQKRTLELFLERGAISEAQFNKSLHDLIEKMGMHEET